MHLVFLIHGLFGNPSHLASLADSLKHVLPDENFVVHSANSMSALGTFNGVEANAELLRDELLAQLRETGATELSIIGYSLGGLCGRYLIGILEDTPIFKRVRPRLFATFATPHLGTNYPHKSLFGFAFDLVGSRIVGYSGRDLFCTNQLIAEMANPQLRYFKGLKRFEHLIVLANTIGDRTVPFWTSYITPKDPFQSRGHIDEVLHSNKYFVDMAKSRWRQKSRRISLRALAKKLAVFMLLPTFLAILVTILSWITLFTYAHHWLHLPFQAGSKRSKIEDEFFSEIGEAMDDTLRLASAETDIDSVKEKPGCPQFGSRGSGFEGVIQGCPQSLDLSKQSLENIANLNELPWIKFALTLPSLNTHMTIVDRSGRSKPGKVVVNAFADIFAELATSSTSATASDSGEK